MTMKLPKLQLSKNGKSESKTVTQIEELDLPYSAIGSYAKGSVKIIIEEKYMHNMK